MVERMGTQTATELLAKCLSRVNWNILVTPLSNDNEDDGNFFFFDT